MEAYYEEMQSVSHTVVPNIVVKNCRSELCSHLGTISLNTSESAKNTEVAFDKAEYAFAVIGIYPKGEGTPKNLETVKQPQLPRNVTDFKQATGFQISRRALRILMLH
jgi:hypothetical protein